MQYAPVAPPHLLRRLRHDIGDFALGRYFLLLAHDVVANPGAYVDLLPPGAFVIMDNSVIELGKPVDEHVIFEACRIVKPDIVVLPDLIGDQQETIKLSIEAASRWQSYLSESIGFMAVPQGNTLEGLKACASAMFREVPRLRMWGVGRFITGYLGSRLQFTRWLAERMYPPKAHVAGFIHQLGFSDNLEDDLKVAKIHGVRGIDSTVPVRLGQKKIMLQYGPFPNEPRGTFWTDEVEQIEPETLANIFLMRNWLAGPRYWELKSPAGATGSTQTV
jgi:hypothetical protein